MSSCKISFIAAFASIAVTGACLHFSGRHTAQEFARLRQSNLQLRFEASQRVRAQSPSAPTVASGDVDGAPAQRLTVAAATAVAPVAPAPAYRNEGQATPLATLQTFAWACDRGDTATVAKLLCFEGGSRAKAEAYMANLPASARDSWNSPEEMAAALLTAANIKAPFPIARVLQTATVDQSSDDRIVLRLPGTAKDRTQYQKTDTGWKYVITEAVVDDYLARARVGK